MKSLLIGDLHLSSNLSYYEYVKDGRVNEKKEILNFIINQGVDCDNIIILGDIFNVYNAPSEVIRDFTNFLEKFGDKDIYIIGGNHDSRADGKATIDYLKEIKGKKWHIISGSMEHIGCMCFLPYLTNTSLECKNNEEARDKIMEMIGTNRFLFLHHTVSNLFLTNNVSVNDIPEVILPQEKLSDRFKMIVLGHIHKSQEFKNVLVTGSIFTHSTDDKEKFIWKLDTETLKKEKIPLPGRTILKIEDPTEKELEKIKEDSIVKVVLNKKLSSIHLNDLRNKLEERFSEKGAYMIIDKTKVIRDRIDYKEGVIDMSIDKLLEIYSKEKEVNLEKLKQGFELIK